MPTPGSQASEFHADWSLWYLPQLKLSHRGVRKEKKKKEEEEKEKEKEERQWLKGEEQNVKKAKGTDVTHIRTKPFGHEALKRRTIDVPVSSCYEDLISMRAWNIIYFGNL